MTPAAPSYLISGMLNKPLRSLLRPVEPAIQKLLTIDYPRRIYVSQASPGAVLDHLYIRIGIDVEEIHHIPRAGAAIIVPNHPFGLLEEAAVAAELPKLRPDIRFLANSLLMEIPGMRGCCIFVNAFGNSGDISRNAGALRVCLPISKAADCWRFLTPSSSSASPKLRPRSSIGTWVTNRPPPSAPGTRRAHEPPAAPVPRCCGTPRADSHRRSHRCRALETRARPRRPDAAQESE